MSSYETADFIAEFKAAMRLIVGNVSVITAGIGQERSGLVVISMVSLSAHPPKVIACIDRSSSTWPLINKFRHFGVSSLATHQQCVAEKFSGFGGHVGPERYQGSEWVTLVTGASLLKGANAAFDCRLDEMIDRGTHSIVIGSVEATFSKDSGGSLLYSRARFHALEGVPH